VKPAITQNWCIPGRKTEAEVLKQTKAARLSLLVLAWPVQPEQQR
jgi:hypothetical protein